MRKIIASLLLAFSSISFAQTTTGALDPTQVYNTGNIVQPTVTGTNSTPWVNGVYQDNLTCWAWGNPGYCGPNAIVRPGNNINFSFGFTDLYQSQAIANVLPNSGSGLRVNGYNFSFMAKNGNGWDDGRVDYLYAYTHFTNQNNQVVYYKNYNLTSKFDWTYFNLSETFSTPFASKDLKNVTYGFVGQDFNGWAGPYGPEIYNISFSLKYSVDPCSVNVLSSPTCPGYLEELAKLAPASTTTTATIETTPTTTASITTDTSNPVVVQYSAPSTSSTSTSQTAPAPVASSSSSSSTSTTTATAAVSQPSSSREVNTNALSIGLSVVARNQQREQTLAMQAAQSAVAATEQTAQQAQQEAVSVAQSSTANSVSFASNPVTRQMQTATRTDVAVSSMSSQMQSSSSFSFANPSPAQTRAVESRTSSISFAPEILSPPAIQVVPTSSAAVVSHTATQTVSTPVAVMTESTSSAQQSSIYSLLPPPAPSQSSTSFAPIVQESRENNQAWTQQQTSQNFNTASELLLQDSPKFLTDRTNPINALMNERALESQSSQPVVQRSSVNNNVSNNEVAGGVDLTRMAITPAGYNQYLNLVIADAAFYAPKEVYRNQRNVDNVRALRTLSSDRLHQEMVDQQYRR